MGRRRKGPDISGLLLIDKPTGMSSFDVVAAVRRAYRTRRVGHTGTLDPMASGLLPILLGRATRLSIYATNARKSYSAEVLFGQSTNTYDLEGEVVFRASQGEVDALTSQEVKCALGAFEGEISQVPPAFSAIKSQGERAYSKARRGETIEMPSRDVIVHQIGLTHYANGRASFDVDCSKGTYIRSIAHDLGQALAVGGTLSALRRPRVGLWTLDEAIPLQQLIDGSDSERTALLRPIRDVVKEYGLIELDDAGVTRVRNGQRFNVNIGAGRYCACAPDGLMIALVDIDEGGELRVVRGIPAAEENG